MCLYYTILLHLVWQEYAWVILTEDELVFSEPDGTPLKPDTITRTFLRIARKVGLHGVRLHDLRHTHASLMLKQGEPVKVVQERLGHATPAITMNIYAHIRPGM